MVNEQVDGGAVLASGLWVPYDSEGGVRPVTQESADAHQKRQKEISDWTTLRFVLRAIARGEIGLHRNLTSGDGTPLVIYQNKLQAYFGIDLAQKPELLRTT